MSGDKIIEGLDDAIAYAKGDKSRGRETTITVGTSAPDGTAIVERDIECWSNDPQAQGPVRLPPIGESALARELLSARATIADLQAKLAAAEDEREAAMKDAYVTGCGAILTWTQSGMPKDDLDEAAYDYVASKRVLLPKEPGE